MVIAPLLVGTSTMLDTLAIYSVTDKLTGDTLILASVFVATVTGR